MDSHKWNVTVLISLTALLLVACGSSLNEESIEISVALTQTTSAQATERAATPTEEPEHSYTGDLQPLDQGDCEELVVAMERALGVSVEQFTVDVEREGKTGNGCKAVAVGDRLVFDDLLSIEESMRLILASDGWKEDLTTPACLGTGGWGPTASAYCYKQANAYCESFIQVDPIDDSLCSDDEPITICLSNLLREQVIYTISLSCARETTALQGSLESELMRIEFEPGGIRAEVDGEVSAGGFDHYVLTAMQGQEMTVNLMDLEGEPIAYDTAALVIWGDDGTVLISSHADALGWSGWLPYTQDYYVDVKSLSAQPVSYSLEVIIPPMSDSGTGLVFPAIEPFPFGEMQTIVLTGVPPILPPSFPIAEGLPEVVPYTLTLGAGEYVFSLDYGMDCHGAGACHYGSMAAKEAEMQIPVGTVSLPFVLEDAQIVDLAKSITGFFVPAVCGANCDDARLWWVYEGYEYMLGLKAGVREDVINLVNAAIENSVQ